MSGKLFEPESGFDFEPEPFSENAPIRSGTAESGTKPESEPENALQLDENLFLEVLLHQMPYKLQQGLAEFLLPQEFRSHINQINQSKPEAASLLAPLESSSRESQGWHREEWRWQWLQDCAAQAQSGLDSCWRMFADFGLSSYVSQRYFASCYRASMDCLEREQRGELRIILRGQEDYPQGLLDLRQAAPRMLFWRGQSLGTDEEAAPNYAATAIIGTRCADGWGLQQAWQEALLLCREGSHWMVSGLAKGCDYAAHNGALDAQNAGGKGKTLAVLPGGFDHIYPKCHEGLARRIVDQGGALVSEYAPQAAPLKWRFIRRDRLQAALVQRILLVQSSLNGGSMHTVQSALELGRAVYVLDGREPCWEISPGNAEDEEHSKNPEISVGKLRLRRSLRQFSRNGSLMSANYALQYEGQARLWRGLQSILSGERPSQ